MCDIQRYAETLYPYDHPDKSDPNFFSFQAGQYFGIILDREDLQGWRLVINADNQKGIRDSDARCVRYSVRYSLVVIFLLVLLLSVEVLCLAIS